jgi:radical SAM-linked protein
VTFTKGSQLKYISHLDLALAWERALRRAGVPLAYSQGHNPQARLQIAAGLPVGYTGSAELLDVLLTEHLSPGEFIRQVDPVLPEGLRLVAVEEAPARSPSLQSALRRAVYCVRVEAGLPAGELARRIAGLLAADRLEQRRTRQGRQETFDLRPLVEDVELVAAGDGQATLSMRLSAGQQGNVRPDAVLAALGLAGAPARVDRAQLLFEFDSP